MSSSNNNNNKKYVLPPPTVTAIPVAGGSTEESFFPVHRIYCIARNYADHVREMGADPAQEPPCFFTKPRDAVVFCGSNNNNTDDDNDNNNNKSSKNKITEIPYALATQNLHYEIELMVAIGKGGVAIDAQKAVDHIYGYAVSLDLTRRDLQAEAKQNGRSWDSAKAFDQSAPTGYLYPKQQFAGEKSDTARIWLSVNGKERQSGHLNQMIWSVPRIVHSLSQQFELMPGDLIMTGTPSGVGPLQVGDLVTGGIDGLGEIAFRIVDR